MKRAAVCQERLTEKVRWEIRKERGVSRTQKIGAESSDPNRHSQPRLPGSVVGKPSMRESGFFDKITEVIVPELLSTPRQPGQLQLGGEPPEAVLLRRHQRMRDRVHRQRDPILHAHFAHQLRHVSLHRALFDPKL